MDQLVDGEAREALVAKTREAAVKLREKGPEPEALPTDDTSVRSAARTDVPVPAPPFWGAREIDVAARRGLPPPRHARALQAALGRARREGRGVAQARLRDDFQPRLERMWREQDYLHPRALLGYFPCYSEGNDLVVLDPDDHSKVLERLVFPRQPKHDRICLADFYRPQGQRRARRRRDPGRHRRRGGHRADGEARGRRRVRRAALHARPRRPDRRGHGRVAARDGPRATSASRSTRAGATRGATPRAPSSPSTRRSTACSTRPRSGCA